MLLFTNNRGKSSFCRIFQTLPRPSYRCPSTGRRGWRCIFEFKWPNIFVVIFILSSTIWEKVSEGEGVGLTCLVEANPRLHSVAWKRDVIIRIYYLNLNVIFLKNICECSVSGSNSNATFSTHSRVFPWASLPPPPTSSPDLQRWSTKKSKMF